MTKTAQNQFEISLNRVKQNQHIFIRGDFNFPGWDWHNELLKPNCQNASLHGKLRNILDDFGLIQIIHKPTRGDNTLNLMITNNPTNINRTEVLPGISDHDCCYTELDINPMKHKQKPRNIPLFNKADWENFRQQMKELNKPLQNCYVQNSANTLWYTFRDTIVKGA